MKDLEISALWFDADQENRFMKKLRQDGKIADTEIALRKKDRAVIWVLAHGIPDTGRDGQLFDR